MDTGTFFANFEAIADIPGGVARLRALILDLAVQGKLVEQDPDDEPASLLLERITQEKARLVKQKKIRKPKTLPPLDEDKVPFVVPPGWNWARLGHLALSFQNGTSKRRGSGEQRIVLRLADIKAGEITTENMRRIGLDDRDAAKYTVIKGDVLTIRVNGSANLVGRLIPVRESAGWAYCDHLIRVRTPIEFVEPQYLCTFGGTSSARSHLEAATVTTAGQKTVNQTGLGTLPVPLPPLAEQQRIVARVDELMALCDDLEAKQQHRHTLKTKFRASALDALMQAENGADLDQAWARIRENWTDLTDHPDCVGEIRQVILQLAIRGKLVEQDPNDEPASVLLERITQEKARLVKEKKIRNRKAPTKLDNDDVPFAQPVGWSWCRFGDALVDIEAGWSPSALKRPKEGDEWGVLKVSACSWGRFLPHENKALDPSTKARAKLEVLKGDFLISRANTSELVARSVVVDDCPPRLMLSDKTLRLHVGKGAVVRYLNLANLSASTRLHYQQQASGTSASMQNVSQAAIREAPIPLPPVAEQERIVTKAYELMALCDDLEQHLTQAHQNRASLAAAATHAVTQPNTSAGH